MEEYIRTNFSTYHDHQERKDIWLFRIATIIILLAALMAFYYFYLIFFPPRVIVYRNIPFPVLTNPATPGKPLIIKISYCKYYDVLPAERTGTLVSDTDQMIEAINITKKFPNGCHDNYAFNGYITPIGTPPGIYHIEADVTYNINGIVTEHDHYSTQKFVIK